MIIEKHSLQSGKSSKEYFVSYRIEDSQELLPGKKRPAVVVCPGGGYLFLSDREEEPIALQFLAQGYHAFVCRYRVGDPTVGLVDVLKDAVANLGETIATIRQNADVWNVDPDKIILIGFSAGGHLVASMSGFWHQEWLGKQLGVLTAQLQPNAAILCYPVIDAQIIADIMKERGPSWDEMESFVGEMHTAMSGRPDPYGEGYEFYNPACHVTPCTPPTFLCHAADDGLVYVENSLLYVQELAREQIPFELHIFEKGGHGFSLANSVTSNEKEQANEHAAKWPAMVFAWLTSHGLS